MRIAILSFAALTAAAACASAEPPPAAAPEPGAPAPVCALVIGGGDPTVAVEGQAGARVGDIACVRIVEGATSVLIGGRPTLTVGARVLCPNGKTGVVEGGAATVFIEGRPAATAQSRIVGCE